jgi:hypothetical protein
MECGLSWAEAHAVVNAFDFSGFRTLVDVGGGHGTLLTTMLHAHPQLHGIVFDQPHVVAGARSRIASEALTPRCDVVAGDFFQAMPHGGDAYILKSIIHDWDDEQSVAILTNCRQAMTAAVRLLVVETVVPPPGEAHYAKYQAQFELVRVVPTQEPLSGLDHGVGHSLLLLYDAKAPLGQKSKEFNGLGHDPSNISIILF